VSSKKKKEIKTQSKKSSSTNKKPKWTSLKKISQEEGRGPSALRFSVAVLLWSIQGGGGFTNDKKKSEGSEQ
jgi:hypothetical protein